MDATSAPRLSWRFVAGCAVALITLFSLQQWVAPLARPAAGLATSFAQQIIAWGVWVLLLPVIVWAARRRPMDRGVTVSWVLLFTAIGVALAILHGIIAATLRWLVGLAVLPGLGENIINTVVLAFSTNLLRYATILIAYEAVVYHNAVRERDRRAARLEIDLARATLANVEARLQPHFLFNTLNAIAALVHDDPNAAERMIGQLSDLLRASLSTDPLREVPLSEELAFVQRYLDIERVRFQDRLRVSVDVTEEARAARVPHLVLQPLVENAVRHGIAPLERGGSISVTGTHVNGKLRLIVADDGRGVWRSAGSATTGGAGIGLKGLRTRLAHLYGDDQRLDVSSRTPEGTIVTLELPYRPALP